MGTLTGSWTGLEELRTAIRRANSDDRVEQILITAKRGQFDAEIRFDREAFTRCMASQATRNIVYLLLAQGQLHEFAGGNDKDHAEPVDIERISVVGMGAMGTGITQAMIAAGLPVTVKDNDPAAVSRGIDRIEKSLRKQVASGRISPIRAEDIGGLLSPAEEWTDVADADLVVEAVFEKIDAKHSVLERLEEVCSADTIIATNTSTISLDDLAAGMQNPRRLVGMHFFNPAQRMPLVEVIRGRSTRPEVVSTAFELARTIHKAPVLVNNREGFIVNRIFLPYLAEAFLLIEDGADPRVVDRTMLEFGFPMGPLALADMAGLDVIASALEILGHAFAHHGPVPAVARRLVEKGYLGQKTGAGVYEYKAGDFTPIYPGPATRIVEEIREETQKAADHAPGAIGEEAISQRLVMRSVNEAFHLLDEGIAQRESDLDAAMVLGTGFPSFRGGPVRYARDQGLDRVLADLEQLTKQLGKRFSPSKFLGKVQKGVGYRCAKHPSGRSGNGT